MSLIVKRLWMPLVLLAMLSSFRLARADSVEKKLESAFILQFARLGEWKDPDIAALDPFVIAVAGDSELKSMLADAAVTKKIKGKRIEVDEVAGSKPGRKSNMVIAMGGSAESVVQASSGCHCMIVSFGDGLASKGAAVNFIRDGGSIKFEASPKSAAKESVGLAPELLKLGVNVDEK